MARVCCLNSKTVRKTVQALKNYGMVLIQERKGTSSVYILTPINTWHTPASKKANPPPEKPGVSAVSPSPGKGGVSKGTPSLPGEGSPPVAGKGYPSPPVAGEGNPVQGDPQKGVSPPAEPRQQAAAHVFASEIHKALKEVRLQKQNLARNGEELSDNDRKERRRLDVQEKRLSDQLVSAVLPSPSAPVALTPSAFAP